MVKVTKIVTNDGECFDTEKEAKKYLDKKYGNKLTGIAHKIIQLYAKYDELCNFLDANIYEFEELLDLKAEMAEGISDIIDD